MTGEETLIRTKHVENKLESVCIVGAGSAGCHLARAAEEIGFSHVHVTDITNNYDNFKSLYGDRYDKMPDKITFGGDETTDYDCYFIATPPDTHLGLASNICKVADRPKILIEKPLCLPDEIDEFDKLNADICVNYNHLYSPGFSFFRDLRLISKGDSGIEVNWLESISHILSSHPWIKGTTDSYLFDYKRGGGSAYEYSHGLALVLSLFSSGNYNIENVIFSDNKISNDLIIYDDFCEINFDIKFESLIGTNDFVHVKSTTDFTSFNAKKNLKCMRGEHYKIVSFENCEEDVCEWSRPGGSGSIAKDKTRSLEFQRGINGALKYWENNAGIDTYDIAKQVVKIIGGYYSAASS